MNLFTRFTTALLIAGVLLQAAERFDNLVRGEFFSGFAGNKEALAHAMKVCEETLAENPKHAEAMVWHGCGNMFLSSQAFRTGDFENGGQLWGKGLREMQAAVTLAPDDVAVVIPRGATLLAASANAPEPQGRPLLEQGVKDYEHVRELQKAHFDQLSGHSKGELLFGLADGYNRLQRKPEATEAFEALLAVGEASGHKKQAEQWLAGRTYEKSSLGCTGCHTGK